MKEKQSKCSVKYISSFRRLHHSILWRKLQTIYKRLFTLCFYLKTKESYDRWVTMRVWGFRHQISKENISKCRSGSFRRTPRHCAKWLRNFRSKRTTFSQPKADFAAVQTFPSDWSDLLAMTVTPSFQLRITHRLKHWIFDFLSFEMTYSMHKLDVRKCSKSGWHDCHQELPHGRFLFASPPCIPDLLMEKDFKASVLHVSKLSISLPWIPNNSPQSWIALVIKKLSKHQNLTQID